MQPHAIVDYILRSDAFRWRLLGIVRELNLPDCWIGAGFVRNAVWDHLHRRPTSRPSTDIDVIYFDAPNADRARDKELQAELVAAEPSVEWDVKNQARMHIRHGDAPYSSSTDALANWSETATAMAVRRTSDDRLEITAPYGLDDLVNLVLRPTPRYVTEKPAVYRERLAKKKWLERWPLLQEAGGGELSSSS